MTTITARTGNALLPDEKRAVAVHEAGHALVARCRRMPTRSPR